MKIGGKSVMLGSSTDRLLWNGQTWEDSQGWAGAELGGGAGWGIWT